MNEKIYTVELWSDGMELKDFSTDKRKALAKTGAALPDGSYPIQNTSDLHNAISAVGRAGAKGTPGYDRAKAHIVKRAKALGAESALPSDWGVTASGKPDGTVELMGRLDDVESAVLGLASMGLPSA